MSPHHDFVAMGTFQSDFVVESQWRQSARHDKYATESILAWLIYLPLMWSLWKFFQDVLLWLCRSYKTFHKHIQHRDRAARVVVMEMSHRWLLAPGSRRSEVTVLYMQPIAPACTVGQGEASTLFINTWIQALSFLSSSRFVQSDAEKLPSPSAVKL